MAFFIAGSQALIANAPTPAGVTQLRRGFADELIGNGGLLRGAARSTVVASIALLVLPDALARRSLIRDG